MTKVISLADPRPLGGVPIGRRARPQSLSSRRVQRFAGATPEIIASVLRDVEMGQVESWADLAEHMLRSDMHIRSVYATRINAIAGAKWDIVPAGPEGEAAAKACKAMLESRSNIEGMFADLLHANGLGWAVVEQSWERSGGEWRPKFYRVEGRNVDFADDLGVWVRTYGEHGNQDYIDTAAERDRWIVHVPGAVGIAAHLSGDLLPIAWAFVFKRWAEMFWMNGAERAGNGILLGKVVENATETARTALREALENVSADHVGVIEQGTEVEFIDSLSGSDTWEKLATYFNAQISKGLLGSTLNVEVSDTGGNRSLGESQFTTTILPRLESMAKQLANTIERDVLTPYLKYNAGLFGGKIPTTPRLQFQLVDPAPAENAPSWDIVSQAGIARADEYRAALGLPELGPEAGGDAFVKIEKSPAPMPGQGFSASEGAPGVPLASHPATTFSRRTPVQQSLPLTVSRISPTSSPLTTRVASVPFDPSDGRGKR